MLIRITSSRADRLGKSRTTNQIMELAWLLTLEEPHELATTLHVAGTFEFTEDVIPDLVQTKTFESVRLLQISTMFIDHVRHDVDTLRLHAGNDIVTLSYDSSLANLLTGIDKEGHNRKHRLHRYRRCKHAFPGSNLKPDRIQTGPFILSNKRSFFGDTSKI
jgi:hypothetical protein